MLVIKTLILFILFVSVALVIGYRLLRLFNFLKALNRIETIVFSFALGMGFISFLVFSLGLLHILFLKWVLLILTLATLISLKNVYLFIKANRSPFFDFKYIYSSKLRMFLAALVSVSLLMTLIGAVAPAKGNDALVYHLSDAKYFAQHHLVTFIPYTNSSIYPYFMEMLFTLAMLFDNPVLAKLFHFSMAFIGSLAIYSFGRRYINMEVAFLAAAIFFLTPGVFTQATYAYNDIAWAFYSFMSFYAILLRDSSSERRLLLFAGVMCGIAADTKYVGLITPVAIGLILIIKGFLHKENFKDLIKSFTLFTITVIVVIFPYYIRPYWYTGNPLYPFYVRYIGENGWYRPSGFGMDKNLTNFIFSPWSLTFYPGKIFGGNESQLSPIYLAFLPVLLFLRKRGRPILLISIFAGIFYFFWFFKFPAVRYILPIIPFLALLCGYVIWALYSRSKLFGYGIKAIFSIFLVLNFGLCIYYNREELAFFSKGANVEDYLATHNRSSKIFQYINKNTPPTSKILLVNEIRDFYLERSHIRELYYRIYDKYQLKEIDTILDDLEIKGITHILYAESRNKKVDDMPISDLDNKFSVLIKNEKFVNEYLNEMVEIYYDFDPLQKRMYRLYSLK
jgi:4-amino-4-deoxy-L-arabinose transferase-like glycosyltransferase